MSSRSCATRSTASAGGFFADGATPGIYRRAVTLTRKTCVRVRSENLRADGELGGRSLIVDPVADLAGQHQRALGLARTVTREPARRRDECLRPQANRIAPA